MLATLRRCAWFIALLFITACEPEFDNHCTITLGAPLNEGDAPIERGWCPGVVPTVVVDQASPCPAEVVQEAIDFWADQGHPLNLEVGPRPAEADRVYGHIYLFQGDPGNGFDGMTGSINTKTKALEVATVVVRNCDPVVVADLVGHALGFGHSLHVDSVMYDTPEVMGLRDSELEAMEEAIGGGQ